MISSNMIMDAEIDTEDIGDSDVACQEKELLDESDHGDEVDPVDDACREIHYRKESSSDEFRAFKNIDRKEEDRLVCLWHKTKSQATLLQLLKLRDQTLWYMARKYAYLDNEDDMYAEFKGVWLKCVKKFNGSSKPRQARDKSGTLVFDGEGKPVMVLKKTPFNTYLYTSMKNRVSNIIKRHNSKRLLDDNGLPVAQSMKSLDFQYGDDGDATLKDVIADEKAPMPHSSATMKDLLNHLGGEDPDIVRAVNNFVNNPRFDTLTAACNYRIGTLRITNWDRNVLAIGSPKNGVEPTPTNARKAMSYLQQMIISTGTFGTKFEMVSFVLHPSRVDFVIHVDDPKVLRKVKEAIMRCRIKLSAEETQDKVLP